MQSYQLFCQELILKGLVKKTKPVSPSNGPVTPSIVVSEHEVRMLDLSVGFLDEFIRGVYSCLASTFHQLDSLNERSHNNIDLTLKESVSGFISNFKMMKAFKNEECYDICHEVYTYQEQDPVFLSPRTVFIIQLWTLGYPERRINYNYTYLWSKTK